MAAPIRSLSRPARLVAGFIEERFVCAWCDRIRALRISEAYEPDVDYVRFGICDACLEAETRALSGDCPESVARSWTASPCDTGEGGGEDADPGALRHGGDAMRRDARSPEAYLEELDEGQREIVERIRKVILKVSPRTEERMEYGMLDYPGLANLAAQKRYVALYVAPTVLADHKEHFPGVSAGKSCLRFSSVEQADAKAIGRLLRDVKAYRRRRG